MDIRFADKKLQDLCERVGVADRKLGPASARKLRNRLADLRAAMIVSDLVAGRPHPLKGSRAGQFGLDLARGDRIVFSVANVPVPVTAGGAINWSQVTLIRIEYVGDYHD